MIRQMLLGIIKTYRLLLSPWLGSSCRFEPTCSIFSIEALHIHGAAKGSYVIFKRLARCHPWCAGGYDPVPLHAISFNLWPFTNRSTSKST